jgi:hypothetical protein
VIVLLAIYCIEDYSTTYENADLRTQKPTLLCKACLAKD